MPRSANQGGMLLLGRALHAPWNEGTRVIARDMARVAATLRPVLVLSLTRQEFRGVPDLPMPVQHVYSGMRYGAAGDYVALHRVVGSAREALRGGKVGVAHLVGMPMALAPWLRARGVRVVSHVTLCEQSYMGRIEQLRAALGWRLFDRWIDMYALSSPALIEPMRRRGISSKKLAVIPAPVDTELYSPEGREKSRKALGIGVGELAVVYVGTLSPLRFPVTTVREGLRLAGEHTGKTISFFGFAPETTHAYNRTWSEDASNGLGDIPNVNARITLGDLTEVQKAHWFRAADAVVVPFAAPVAVEPPLTLLEAMSCAAPVLVTPHANRSGAVRDGYNGRIYETPEQLGEMLAGMLDEGNAKRTERMTKAARDSMVSEHSFAAVAKASAEVWRMIEGA